MWVRWLVWLISSLVVSIRAGSFTPTLSIRHPQELLELGDSSASQWSACLLLVLAIGSLLRSCRFARGAMLVYGESLGSG